ncbi:glycosyltransferase family 2 protein [Pontibacter qinzhouensis]|uniref:Glycosyltransferase family 2 protein n=1 Tax=Pontibacter qinzhouensis TaxID=2603253 RepID=A0A5C8KDK7_9BACT|nr:glycosyltransferase family 2 protein [Pontibacter qinzhouensis]TXK50803.1 glycosyltransferase family 2 protein [Pontibacter qinzhouensis]
MNRKLSVVIITYNEEESIGRCLESVAGIADEIVVVDSFSTDRTKEICEAHGVTFSANPFKGHIEQKNYALNLASHDYVLSLDADEALTPELRQAVAAAKANWTADAYKLARLTNYCGSWIKHGGWYPDWKVRLFDKRKAHWGGQNPHDRIILTGEATLGVLKGDLLHYSYFSIKQHLDQVNFFTEIAYQEMRSRNKSTSVMALLLKPPFKFIKMYFIQLGFLDGFAGFCIAVISSYAVFVKYAKLYLFNKNRA